MEHYYHDIQAPTNKQNWIIDSFAVTNLPELPIRVAKKFTEVTAEPANRISFNCPKKNTQKYQRTFFLGFNALNLSEEVSICDSTTDSICDYLALRSGI